MMFIRQLGLKAYIDFPGAIHTRYAHVLGVMHLAGKMVDILAKEQEDKGRRQIANNLRDNRNNIMAAGFLHDIAHGPFSHAVDFPLKKLAGKTHEQIAADVIPRDLRVLEGHGISIDSVIRIINDEHDYPFISNIINSQLDADKLDYLLRDAHNVGYRYSFDLDHFVNLYTVIGEEKDFKRCLLGLQKRNEAIVTSEIFIMIWKSMYDLVYHVHDSRIAEKMLEKATLVATEENKGIRSNFTRIARYLKLHDDMLLSELEKVKGFPKNVADRIKRRDLFSEILEIRFEEEKMKSIPAVLAEDPDDLSDRLSREVSSIFGVEKYQIICDIFKTRAPKKIHIDSLDETGEPIDIISSSEILHSMRSKAILRIYVDPVIEKTIDNDRLKTKIKALIERKKA